MVQTLGSLLHTQSTPYHQLSFPIPYENGPTTRHSVTEPDALDNTP